VKLLHGDCLELMKDIPDKSVDMILCDLPYGTTNCKWDELIPLTDYIVNGKRILHKEDYLLQKYKEGVNYKETLESWEREHKKGLWYYYNKIIKDNGAIVLTATQPFTSALVMSNPKMFKYCWTWDKITAKGHLVAKYRPMQQTEDIVVFGKNKVNYYPIMIDRPKNKITKSYESSRTEIMGGISKKIVKVYDTWYPKTLLKFKTERGLHPTQKPVPLFEYLIKTYTNEGETVLDNCMGSGTTGVACKNLNRNFIGIELNDKYFEMAKERIESHKAQRPASPLW
jgi:site-specific DNA-methyltransferase (adenine-specific)